MSQIVEGATAPDFSLPRNGGETVTLSALRGNWIVLYFYPRDDTPGCTTEGQDFTALKDDFAARSAVILGVSRDSVASHEKFCAKRDIGVALLSDADGAVCEAYGVWVEKSMYGKKSMGVERATFLIDPEGAVSRVWRKVRAAGHAAKVLEAITEK